MPTISVADHIANQNLIGEYQWLVDEGDGDAWAALFLEDGEFLGGLAEPVRGHEQLKLVEFGVKDGFDGQLRHATGSMYIRYGDTTDTVIAKYYNLVATWMGDPKLFTMALSEMHLVRREGGWKIKGNHIRNLSHTRKLGENE